MLNIKLITQTSETDAINGWVYRIIEDEKGVLLQRVPNDNQLWSHGSIRQVYQPDVVAGTGGWVISAHADYSARITKEAAINLLNALALWSE